jgi:hypothetical protein
VPDEAPRSSDPLRDFDQQGEHQKNVEVSEVDLIQFCNIPSGLAFGRGAVLESETLGERWTVTEFSAPLSTARVKVLSET